MLRLTTALVTLGLLAGCAARRPAVAEVARPLAPGDARLDLAAVTAPSRRTSTVYVERAGERQRFGTLTEEVRRTSDGGLVRVHRLESARGG